MLNSYDGAGKQYVDAYDFKGLPITSYMQLLEDATISDANWNILTDADLSPEIFTSSLTTDALGRPVSTTDPGNNTTENTYERDGALKTVVVNSDTYVQDIRHNAKSQREAIWYGNDTKTSYTYDDLSQRLSRLHTVNLTTNDILQDLHYFYDAVGNITTIRDDAQQALFFDNTIVNPDLTYTYDSLYRLIVAEGREQIGLATFGTDDNYNDSAWQTSHKGDATATQRYIQKYSYDKVGNMHELQHLAGSGSYTRTYTIDGGSNSLERTQVGAQVYDYTHDTRGNMVTMPHLSAMDYDLLNQMQHLTAGTVDANYQYSGGERVRKYVDKGGGLSEERIYFGGFELYRKYLSGTIDVERSTVHVQDDMGRIAMLEVRNTTYNSDGSAANLKRYIYSNHLLSATLELDGNGDIISYEEYHPYGTTAYQAMNSSINAVAKRYRFTGKERDEETGLNYHGARYYALWLCRWCAVDPLEVEYAGWSSYNYCFCNPMNFTDGSGMGAGEDEKKLPNNDEANDGNTSNMGLKYNFENAKTEWNDLPKSKNRLEFIWTPTQIPVSIASSEKELTYQTTRGVPGSWTPTFGNILVAPIKFKYDEPSSVYQLNYWINSDTNNAFAIGIMAAHFKPDYLESGLYLSGGYNQIGPSVSNKISIAPLNKWIDNRFNIDFSAEVKTTLSIGPMLTIPLYDKQHDTITNSKGEEIIRQYQNFPLQIGVPGNTYEIGGWGSTLMTRLDIQAIKGVNLYGGVLLQGSLSRGFSTLETNQVNQEKRVTTQRFNALSVATSFGLSFNFGWRKGEFQYIGNTSAIISTAAALTAIIVHAVLN